MAESRQLSSSKDIRVRLLPSTASKAEQDRRFAALLAALIEYRRADEAAGVVFTNQIGEPLPLLPLWTSAERDQ